MSILKLKDENGNWNSIPTLKGDTGNGIESTVLNSDYTLTINYTDGTDYTTPSIRGEKGSTGSTGAKGDKGDKGDQGIQGERGLTGATPNLTVGTVDTLTPNDDATVNITGTAENPVLNFGIPKGDIGEVTNDDLTKLAIKDAASGGVASFVSDVDNIPMNSVKVRIDPVQDLHGLDTPYPAGGRKNLLYAPNPEIVTINGVTWTCNQDGSITISGTATDASTYRYIPFSGGVGISFDGDYKLVCFGSDISTAIFHGGIKINTWISFYGDRTTAITGASGQIQEMWFQVKAGQTLKATIYPMIYKASESAPTAWTPYENICPISGWTEINAYNDPLHGGFIEWNQLVQNGNFADGSTGWTGNNGSVSASNNVLTFAPSSAGTKALNFGVSNATSILTVVGHKYFYSFYAKVNTTSVGGTFAYAPLFDSPVTKALTANTDTYISGIRQASSSVKLRPFFYPWGTTSVTLDGTERAYIHDVIVIDLTQMFGEGNEPSTVEEFRALFPNDYYPYNEGEKTCVSAVNGNPYRHATIDLGQTVYGGTVDIATGELVIDKVCVDLGTLNYGISSSGTGAFYTTGLRGVIVDQSYRTAICSQYVGANGIGTSDCVFSVDAIGTVYIRDERYDGLSASEFKAAMSGVQLCYELAEPISVNIQHSELRSILGQNKIFADSGDVDITYCVDTKTYIDTIAEDHQEQIATKASLDDVVDKAPVITDTTSGAIASFTDGADDLPLKSLIVDINPIQDLHGQDSPYPAGGGVNKFNPFQGTHDGVTWTTQSDGTSRITGTALAAGWKYLFEVYDLPWRGISAGDSVVVYSDVYMILQTWENDTWVSKAAPANRYVTATIPSNVTKIRIIQYPENVPATEGETYDIVAHYYIAKGSTFTSWSPYENICPISGWTQVDVEQRGKNLFDKDGTNSVINGYINSSGVFKTSSSGEKCVCVFLPVGTYTVSKITTTRFIVTSFDSLPSNNDTGTVLSTNPNASKATFTIDKNKWIVCFVYNNTGESNTFQSVLDTVQFELGSTATPYDPYTGRSITIQLGQTVYGGHLDVLSGVLTVDRAMVDLGTLEWNYSSGSAFNLRSKTALENAKLPSAVGSVPSAICSSYPMLSYNAVSDTDKSGTIIFATSLQAGKVWFHDSAYSDASSFASAMSGVQLCYELATPIEIQLDAHAINSLYGVNNIWADSGDVTVGYCTDTKLYIQKKIAEAISALS